MGNWLNIVIILVAIGGPVLGAIWKRLEAAAERRRIEQEIQRRRDEALRTGQAFQPLASPAAQTQATLDPAAQHRARLEELRRRQQERLRQAAAGGQVRATPSTVAPGQIRPGLAAPPMQRPAAQRAPMQRPSSSIPTRPGQSGRSAPVRQTVPQQSQRVSQQQGTSKRTPTPRQAPHQAPTRSPAGAPADRKQVLAGLVQAIEKDERSSRGVEVGEIGEVGERGTSRAVDRGNRAMARAFGSPRPTRADLRRAIVLREVLDAPVALRGEAGAGGPF